MSCAPTAVRPVIPMSKEHAQELLAIAVRSKGGGGYFPETA
jgi:hypothetical protein